jgi:hypothetical protein
MQLTHSLKPGSNPRAYKSEKLGQMFAFKFNLYRYDMAVRMHAQVGMYKLNTVDP